MGEEELTMLGWGRAAESGSTSLRLARLVWGEETASGSLGGGNISRGENLTI